MKFLIIKTSSLGDIIHVFPALAFLRQKFPYAQIDWVVEAPFAGLLLTHPQISHVLTVETKKWRKGKNLKGVAHFFQKVRKKEYDYVFDLQGNVKSSLLLAMTRAKNKVGFGWKSVPEWPNALFTSVKVNPPSGSNIREDYLNIVRRGINDDSPFKMKHVVLNMSEEERAKIETLFQSLPSGQKILVAPGAAWKNKQLSLEQLCSFLGQKKEAFFLFSWGSEEEKKLSQLLQSHFPHNSLLLEKVSLPLLQNLMARVDLVVAMDSLPLHLAGTTHTPTFSFFGPTLPEKYIPLGQGHHFKKGECPYGITFNKRCPRLRTCKTGACIKSIEF